MEVPLVIGGELAVGECYLHQLVKVANCKMSANTTAINRLRCALEAFFAEQQQQLPA